MGEVRDIQLFENTGTAIRTFWRECRFVDGPNMPCGGDDGWRLIAPFSFWVFPCQKSV
jgi:hypothetical protein